MTTSAPLRRPRGRPPLVEDRRQQIVDGAFREIAAKGLAGFRVREVAAAIGVDHTTVLHYFPTKQVLLTAVIDHATRFFWGTTPTDGAPRERLRAHLRSQAKAIAEQPALLLVLREFDLLAIRDPEVAALKAGREQGWRAVLLALFDAGRAEACWPPDLVAEDAADLVIAAVKGASLAPAASAAVLAQLERLFSSSQAPSSR